MALTRANVEAILIKRVGALMTAVGLDGTTVAGTNADLNDPIGYAIRMVGGTTAAPALITDADVTTVATADYDEFLDIAELRALENTLGNLAYVDIKVGNRDEKLGQLSARLEKMIAGKTERLQLLYGYSQATLEAGTVTLNFAEHDEDTVDELGW